MWIKAKDQYLNTNAAEAIYVRKSTPTGDKWNVLLWCPPSSYPLGSYSTRALANAAMEKLVKKLGTIK